MSQDQNLPDSGTHKRLGLVLAGGGGKGAYHIGVWKALKEYGVDKNIGFVSGTSVGALNGALFAYGDYNLAEEVWLNISPQKFLSPEASKIFSALLGMGIPQIEIAVLASICQLGVCSREGLLDIINNNLDLSRFSNDIDIKVYAGAYNISKLQMDYLPILGKSPDKIKQILLASSAMPVIYRPVCVDGNTYIDGGIKNNIPIQPLAYDDECRFILAVHLGRSNTIEDEEKYRSIGKKIIEIVPSKNQGDFLDGTLDFSREGSKKRIKAGYNDTVQILEPLYKSGELAHRLSETLSGMASRERDFDEQHRSNLDRERDVDEEYRQLEIETERRKGK